MIAEHAAFFATLAGHEERSVLVVDDNREEFLDTIYITASSAECQSLNHLELIIV